MLTIYTYSEGQYFCRLQLKKDGTFEGFERSGSRGFSSTWLRSDVEEYISRHTPERSLEDILASNRELGFHEGYNVE